MFRKITPLIPLLCCAGIALAQSPGQAYQYLDGNQVKARIQNSADHFFDQTMSPSYEVPKGSGKHTNFAHSLWIGAYDTTGALHMAAETYRQGGVDFKSGAYRPSHVYDTGLGFDIPSNTGYRGLIDAGSGKWMAIYTNGYTVYDPVTEVNTPIVFPGIRYNLQGIALPNGKVFLFGDDQYPTVQSAYFADPAFSYQAQPAINLTYFHRNSTAVMLQSGQILIAGLTGAELYDPGLNQTATTQAMPIPVQAAGAIRLQDGRVLVAGGVPSLFNFNTPRPETQIYDPGTNTWAQGPNMPTGRVFPVLLMQANGRVLILGGSITDPDVFEYNPAGGGTITTVGSLNLPMQYCNGAYAANGDVLVAGLENLYRYNPATGQTQEEGYFGMGNQIAALPTGDLLCEFAPLQFRKYDPVRRRYHEMPYQKVWKLSKAQIDQFRQDYLNSQVDFTNYPDIQTWPGQGNTALGEDVHLAPFVDVNNDGLYRPGTQGDYPCITGDQALWWVFNDDGAHTETDGLPLGVQVEAMAYVIDCNTSPCPDSAIDYTTFYHYEIVNKSAEVYRDFRIGLWNDADLGNPFDDFVGSDTSRGLGFSYNGDANDETALGYGLNAPAFGSMMLGDYSMTNFMTYENTFSTTGNPVIDADYYNYMASVWKDSTHLVNNGTSGHISMGAGPDADFTFPGDPGWCVFGGGSGGWSEVSAANIPYDRRFVQSTSLDTLMPGERISFDFAFIWTRAFSNDQFGSVCTLQQAADAVDAYWTGMDRGCFSLVLDRETPQPAFDGFKLFPNPAQHSATIALSSPASAASIFVRDLSGRLLSTQSLPESSLQAVLNLEVVPDGIYLITLVNEGKASTRKLSVQH